MRGKQAPKRQIQADPKYHSVVIAKFINILMRRGKKTLSQKIVYECFDVIKEKTQKNPLETFDLAIKNVSPDVEVKSRRIGGGNYQIPIAVVGPRKLRLAYIWIIGAARARKGMPMKEKLALEFIDASHKTGSAIKKREDVYRMAEANRAFAHFAHFKR